SSGRALYWTPQRGAQSYNGKCPRGRDASSPARRRLCWAIGERITLQNHSTGWLNNTPRHRFDSRSRSRTGRLDKLTTNRSVARLLYFAWTSRRFPKPRLPKAATQRYLLGTGGRDSRPAPGTERRP